MNTEHLPSTARLRRSLARRRVRELRTEHPILEWLFGRFVVTETALHDWVQHDADCQRECDQVLRGNGYEEDTASASLVQLVQEVQAAAFSLASPPLDESEKPALLLVDDDQLLLRAARRVLRAQYVVLISPGPTDALRVLDEEKVDVLVTDYEIPNTKGGVWLLEQAKQRFPNVARILISSRAVPQDVTASDAVDRFVHKNAGIDQLIRTITECLA